MQQVPSGNAFIVETPYLDSLHNRLYNEQQQQRLQRQRDVAALDDEFTRNVANIKDADVDDLTAVYNDYKQSSQKLMKQKGGVDPKQQLEVLRKKAAMYKLINESKEEKEAIKLLGKAISSDAKGIYDAGAAARLSARLRTPTSKYGNYSEPGADGKPMPVDLRDANAYLYKLGASDFSKDFETAAGRERDLTPDDPIQDPNDKFKMQQKTYKGKNNPIEYYNTLLPRIAGSKEQKDFVLRTQIDYPPEKVAALEQQFNELMKDPSYRKRYGLKDGDNIPLSSYDSDVAKAARIRAMQHAVDTRFTEGKPLALQNTEAITADRQKFAKEQQQRAHQNSLARLYVYAGIQDRKPEAIGRNIDGLITGHIESGRGNGGVVVTDADTYESITGEKKGSSSILMVDEAGNYKYGKKGEDGKLVVKGEIPLDAAKIKLTQTYKSGLDSRYNTGNKEPVRTPKEINKTRMQPQKVTDPAILKKLNGN